ncbi:MAG TPA: MBL fold metallo-hydrolase [Gammaproteobacteria bacterium]
MQASVTRRDFLVGAAAAGGLALPGVRAAAQSPALRLVELRERVAVVQGAGANVTVLATDGGLVLVDGGGAEHADALIALLGERWPGAPIRDVFNTNWRPEHTGANAALRAAGARIHAHENTKLWMGARFEVKWQRLAHEPCPADALPTHTFYGSGRLELGGVEIRYGHLKRAHTDGDVFVHFPAENVFAVGDLLAAESYPLPDYETGGWIGGMVDATEALLDAVDADSVIVPADGGVERRPALEAQLELCRTAMTQAAATYRAGGTLEDYIAAAAPRLDPRRGDPTLFLTLVYDGGYYHARELGGIV